MSDDDNSLDLTGAGKLAKAIPPKAWEKIVDTTCKTFSDLVAPITKTTAGIGRLIEAKFKKMADVEKVFAADAVKRVKEKVDKSERKPIDNPKSKILLAAIDYASTESDDSLRDIWANLIANEILDGQVHPEFPKTLERLSSNDAITLAEIGENQKDKRIRAAASELTASISILGIKLSSSMFEEPSDFSREHLTRLGIIKKKSGQWMLTHFGAEFLKAVTDPSFKPSERKPLKGRNQL